MPLRLGTPLLAVALLLASLQPAAATAERPATSAAATLPPPAFGAYVDGMQADPTLLDDFEDLVGAETDIASYYYGYGDVFPGATELAFADGGDRRVLLSWHLDGTRFVEWTRGRHDAYLDQIAAAARAYPYKLWVRPWPEMNGDWQPFQPTPDGDRSEGGTYDQFKDAWRYVVTYLRDRGATNLRWVFNPSADTYEGTTPVGRIWPGRSYVDVVGIDGFNWGRDDSWGRWKSFDAIFGDMYDKLVALHPDAPVWICEFSSKEPLRDDGAPRDPDHSKGNWLARALDRDAMPRIKAMVFFHADKERDWRVDSSRDALDGLRQALAER